MRAATQLPGPLLIKHFAPRKGLQTAQTVKIKPLNQGSALPTSPTEIYSYRAASSAIYAAILSYNTRRMLVACSTNVGPFITSLALPAARGGLALLCMEVEKRLLRTESG